MGNIASTICKAPPREQHSFVLKSINGSAVIEPQKNQPQSICDYSISEVQKTIPTSASKEKSIYNKENDLTVSAQQKQSSISKINREDSEKKQRSKRKHRIGKIQKPFETIQLNLNINSNYADDSVIFEKGNDSSFVSRNSDINKEVSKDLNKFETFQVPDINFSAIEAEKTQEMVEENTWKLINKNLKVLEADINYNIRISFAFQDTRKMENQCSLEEYEPTPEGYHFYLTDNIIKNLLFIYENSLSQIKSAILDGLLCSTGELYSPTQEEEIAQWAQDVQVTQKHKSAPPRARGHLSHLFHNVNSFTEMRNLMISRQKHSKISFIVEKVDFYSMNEVYLFQFFDLVSIFGVSKTQNICYSNLISDQQPRPRGSLPHATHIVSVSPQLRTSVSVR